jgi:hypothetical protein
VPTKRRRILPTKINQAVPAWAERLLATGEPPAEDDPDHDAYFGWRFGLDAPVPGLPHADTDPKAHAQLAFGKRRQR